MRHFTLASAFLLWLAIAAVIGKATAAGTGQLELFAGSGVAVFAAWAVVALLRRRRARSTESAGRCPRA